MLISAEQLKNLLETTSSSPLSSPLSSSLSAPVLVDCRHDLFDAAAGERAYVAGHLPGAYFVNTDTHLSGKKSGSNGRHPLPDASNLSAVFNQLGLNPKRLLVVYDNHSGQYALRLWWLARWLGHTNVLLLDKGYDAWVAAGGAVETGMPDRIGSLANAASTSSGEKNLPYQAGQMPTVNAEQILSSIESKQLTIIDARAANRYRGETEPIDPVAGHIPGALNRPLQNNLDSAGCFKSAEQLRGEFLALLTDGPSFDSVVHQCGSGITACHNLFAMELAGLHGSRLYPGSWSEWVSEPSRPIATGG